MLLTLLLWLAGTAHGRELRVMTYNVWGLPGVLTVLPGRFPRLVREIRKLDVDVVALQEIFTARAKPLTELVEFPYRAFGPGRKGIRTNSGLLILSRYPIVQTATIEYPECRGSDCFANKGALWARIDVNGQFISVFTTHTNAGQSAKIKAARALQIDRFLAFIQNSAGSDPVLILTDLNSKPDSAAYDTMRREGFRDSHAEYRETVPLSPVEYAGNTLDPIRNRNIRIGKWFVKPFRIDYVWVRGNWKVIRTQLMFDHLVEGRFLSDHFGVRADLVLESEYVP